MNIRFIDTSVMTNLLNIPNKNENAQETQEEFKRIVKSGEQIVIPLTTIIETGNHISHIGDGNMRRIIAIKFTEFIAKALDGRSPWFYDEYEMTKEDLKYIVENFQDNVTADIGFGDLSIIRQYEIFKSNNAAIGRIMIWSYDKHLQGYSEDLTGVLRRRAK